MAVLFFKDLAANPENAHLGLGLADSTITELALVKSLLVRPTAAILRYRDRAVSPEEAGARARRGRGRGRELPALGLAPARDRAARRDVRRPVALGIEDRHDARRHLPDAGRSLAKNRTGAGGRAVTGGREAHGARGPAVGRSLRALPEGPVVPPLRNGRGHPRGDRGVRTFLRARPPVCARARRPGQRLHAHGIHFRTGRRLARARRGDEPQGRSRRAGASRRPLPGGAACLVAEARFRSRHSDPGVPRRDRGPPEPYGCPRAARSRALPRRDARGIGRPFLAGAGHQPGRHAGEDLPRVCPVPPGTLPGGTGDLDCRRAGTVDLVQLSDRAVPPSAGRPGRRRPRRRARGRLFTGDPGYRTPCAA